METVLTLEDWLGTKSYTYDFVKKFYNEIYIDEMDYFKEHPFNENLAELLSLGYKQKDDLLFNDMEKTFISIPSLRRDSRPS